QPTKVRSDGNTMSHQELTRAIESFIEKLVGQDKFSGAALVAKDGVPIFKKAYGLASKGYNAPNRVDTKFNLGSMNKMFTGVAIAQLAEQGKLSFDDSVGWLEVSTTGSKRNCSSCMKTTNGWCELICRRGSILTNSSLM